MHDVEIVPVTFQFPNVFFKLHDSRSSFERATQTTSRDATISGYHVCHIVNVEQIARHDYGAPIMPGVRMYCSSLWQEHMAAAKALRGRASNLSASYLVP